MAESESLPPFGNRMTRNMKVLERYVGRCVRLKASAIGLLPKRRRHDDGEFDNCFLVAAVSGEMKKLICYGANTRIAVGAADVVLI